MTDTGETLEREGASVGTILLGLFAEHGVARVSSARSLLIYGLVTAHEATRMRGAEGSVPLRINPRRGAWSQIEQAWAAGDLDVDQVEEDFIADVIYKDIGDIEGVEFPGDAYRVTVA